MGFENGNVFSHENALHKENRVYFSQFLSAVSHFLFTSLRGNVTVCGRRLCLVKIKARCVLCK